MSIILLKALSRSIKRINVITIFKHFSYNNLSYNKDGIGTDISLQKPGDKKNHVHLTLHMFMTIYFPIHN